MKDAPVKTINSVISCWKKTLRNSCVSTKCQCLFPLGKVACFDSVSCSIWQRCGLNLECSKQWESAIVCKPYANAQKIFCHFTSLHFVDEHIQASKALTLVSLATNYSCLAFPPSHKICFLVFSELIFFTVWNIKPRTGLPIEAWDLKLEMKFQTKGFCSRFARILCCSWRVSLRFLEGFARIPYCPA